MEGKLKVDFACISQDISVTPWLTKISVAYHNKSLILAHTSCQPSSSRDPAHCGYSSIHCQSLQWDTYCEERGRGGNGVALPFEVDRTDRPSPATRPKQTSKDREEPCAQKEDWE